MTTRSAVSAPSSAREAAFAVLHRAEAADAFVSALLYHTLARSSLSAADRALATAITLGVLRHRERLDFALAPFLRRPLASLPPAIRTVLRMGCYQLLELNRIRPATSVSEAVSLARRHGHRGTAGLVNAVLRRLAAEGPPPPPDSSADPVSYLAVAHSHPRWLVARWAARWGITEAGALAAANTQIPPSTVRVNTLLLARSELLDAFRARGVTASPGQVSESIRVCGSLVARLPLLDRGCFAVQDEAAMLVARAVAPTPGQVVIDACAAPGGKTMHLAALMGNTGRVVAADVHPGKVRTLAERAGVMGATCVDVQTLDARELGRQFPEHADAVLVDAPCSGLGTVRRRPEIKWRVEPNDLHGFAETQLAILSGAAGAVRPGGTLVYSVCSLEPEEGPQVIRAFLDRHPGFAPAPLPQDFPREIAGAPVGGPVDGEALLLPHRHGTDGFYVARLRRIV